MTRTFPLRVVLTVTTGRLLTAPKGPRDNGIGDLYELLNYMTGDNLFTHQLPRAGEACKEPLLQQHPQLRAVNVDAVNGDNWKEWLAEQVAQYGEYLEVTPLVEWTHIDPILEAETMVGKDKVIQIEA